MNELARELSGDQIDRELRLLYHTPLKVTRLTDERVDFYVNRNWIPHVHEPHKQLVALTQLFYDIAPWFHRGRMAPSELVRVISSVIETENEVLNITSINTSILDSYRGRPFASLRTVQPELLPASKCDWTRMQLRAVRHQHPALAAYTASKQLDVICHQFKSALLNGDPKRLPLALQEIENFIWIDTRSERGRPKNWLGLPLNPPQASRAWLHSDGSKWELSLDRLRLSAQLQDWLAEGAEASTWPYAPIQITDIPRPTMTNQPKERT